MVNEIIEIIPVRKAVDNRYKYLVTIDEVVYGIPKSRVKWVFGDGRFSNEGVDYYLIENYPAVLRVDWSRWQGVGTSRELMPLTDAIQDILGWSNIHPSRVQEALNELGHQIPELPEE